MDGTMKKTNDIIDFINILDKLESGEVDAVTTDGWWEDEGNYITLADDQWGKRLVLNSPNDSQTGMPWSISFNDIVKIKFRGLRF